MNEKWCYVVLNKVVVDAVKDIGDRCPDYIKIGEGHVIPMMFNQKPVTDGFIRVTQ